MPDEKKLELEQLLEDLLSYVRETDAPIEMATIEVLLQLRAYRVRTETGGSYVVDLAA